MGFITRFLNADDGATAIEYGLLAALIVVAIIGVLGLLYGRIGAVLLYVSSAVGAK